jgi:long-chain acyl-CoA synthetase
MGLRTRLESKPGAVACIWRDQASTYDDLLRAGDRLAADLRSTGVTEGDVVAVVGDYSPTMIAALLALFELGAVAVPLPPSLQPGDRDAKLRIARADHVISIEADDTWTLTQGPGGERFDLVDTLVQRGHPGLVVFTSGTTGEPKAILHDFEHFLHQFDVARRGNVTLAFFLPDHMAGLNTLFYALCNGGTIVCVEERTPSAVCSAIERHHVQFLPTSPTFLRLCLLADAHLEHDLSSLELVTFGSEPMHDQTLSRLQEAMPSTRFHQVYGLAELNTLRSEPRAPGSRWLRLRPENYDVKIKDGRLWVKTTSAMLGYLNAPSPFDEEGWFDTGDAVETEGEYVRILGRDTEIINVGGDKVYPAEVEDVIMRMSNVSDATVHRHYHPIIGQVVAATVVLEQPEPVTQFKRRLRAHCAEHLARYKVPVKVELTDQTAYSERFKKSRRATQAAKEESGRPVRAN